MRSSPPQAWSWESPAEDNFAWLRPESDPKPENETTGKLKIGLRCGSLSESGRRTDATRGAQRLSAQAGQGANGRTGGSRFVIRTKRGRTGRSRRRACSDSGDSAGGQAAAKIGLEAIG
jgi:hypothetical protein